MLSSRLTPRCATVSRWRPARASFPRPKHGRCLASAFTSDAPRGSEPKTGTVTPLPDTVAPVRSNSLFYFEAGYALYAKRPPRPFPPPFLSPPSGSFSDPLSTHNQSRDRRPKVNGQMIRGISNGDDAVLVSDNFICANDGVGAWATKERGHAALWSRLLAHFWALEAERDAYGGDSEPDLKRYLETAYNATKLATSQPTEWLGTSTTVGALLTTGYNGEPYPLLYITQLGDSQVLVLRPEDKSTIFKTTEQWHWFDCPRQLGTNSPDTPEKDAHMDKVRAREGDVVLALSDGVTDNLWEHEVVENVVSSMGRWSETERAKRGEQGEGVAEAEGMKYVAQQLVKAAREIAEDPFAESPFMERGIEEGLSIEGGKLDDISVVAAICRRRQDKTN